MDQQVNENIIKWSRNHVANNGIRDMFIFSLPSIGKIIPSNKCEKGPCPKSWHRPAISTHRQSTSVISSSGWRSRSLRTNVRARWATPYDNMIVVMNMMKKMKMVVRDNLRWEGKGERKKNKKEKRRNLQKNNLMRPKSW